MFHDKGRLVEILKSCAREFFSWYRYSADPVNVIKTLIQFQQDNEEIFHVIGGRFDGRKFPNYLKEEMRSQFLASGALLTALYCLENKSQNNSSFAIKRGSVVSTQYLINS